VSDDLSIPSPTYRVPRRRQRMDPGTRRLALIAGGLGAALVVVVGGWEMVGHRSTTVPVVQADNRPIRVKPDNPGGMQVAGANEDILSGGTESATGKLAPPPEAPSPQALRAPPPPAVAPPAPAPAPIVTASQPPVAAVRSEDAAKSEWERLSKRFPELLGSHHPAFSKTERDGRTLWRVRTGGFSDVPQATSFCEKVRAKGAACSVADF
jgi:hypothetical protein